MHPSADVQGRSLENTGMSLTGSQPRRRSMRLTMIFPLLAGFAFLAIAPAAHAQSAYDYPWCAIYANRSGAQACYYASYEQCAATMSGIGGYCIRSPYYRGGPR
jgi:Protein of unknown function (DUF3551)